MNLTVHINVYSDDTPLFARSVNITPIQFPSLDKILDAELSNTKMNIFTYVRSNFPHVFYKDSPLPLPLTTLTKNG